MAKSPDQPREPGKPKNMVKRDPAKHSKKDPAKPTRAKASRPDQPPAELLNPGIGQGTTGPGSQTGLEPAARQLVRPRRRLLRGAPGAHLDPVTRRGNPVPPVTSRNLHFTFMQV